MNDVSKPTPEFLFFDMGNVLITFEMDGICERMAQVAGVAPEVIHTHFFSASGMLWEAESGRITSHQLYEEFCRRTGTRPDEDELNAAACSTFAVNVPILPVLIALKRAGWQLGILSNICEAHWKWCLEHYRFLTDLFDCQLASYELGCSKPAAEIFELAADHAGRCLGVMPSPERIVFTDDIPRNVVGAEQAGWDAEPFTNVESLVAALRRRGVPMAL